MNNYLKIIDFREYMKLAVLFSGGKDSTYALFKIMKNNEIKCLISIISENKESYMFHTPNIEITKLQAKSLEIPLISKKTKGIKEEELEDLKNAIIEAKKKYEIEGVITGAVESVYQSSRIKKICDELDLKCINPLWKRHQEELLKEIIDNDFKFIITSISADGLDESFLGKVITKEDVGKLAEINKKYGISLMFEGGEAETLVISCPIFKKKLIIEKAEKIMESENTGIYKITKASLESK